MKVFGSKASGHLTPDPFVLSQIDKSGKAKDAGMDAPAESGAQTPRFIGEVNIEAVRSKLERLQAENEQSLKDFSVGPHACLTNSSLDADTRTASSSTNFDPPWPAFVPVPSPPVTHPGHFSCRDRLTDLQAEPVKSHIISEQVVSKGSVGHPFKCAPACRYVKRKGGCRDAEACPNCHHCFWSKANATTLDEKSLAKSQSENSKLREAKTLANRLVSLLGGEEPFAAQAKKFVKPDISLGTMGHPLTCADPCESDAGLVINLDAAIPNPYAAPVLSTNPVLGQPKAYPKPQDAPRQMPWCSSLGSMGHPYSCAAACKYAMKANGCKDGAMCDHCHLCRWKRQR